MVDALVSDQISTTEDALGGIAWYRARRVDEFIPSPWDLIKKARGSS